MRAALLTLALLALPGWGEPAKAGKQARQAYEYLAYSCDLGRIPADLRLPAGQLPPAKRSMLIRDPPTDTVIVEVHGETRRVGGVPASAGNLRSSIAEARRTFPDRPIGLALGADLPPERWTAIWAEVATAERVFLLLEHPGRPRLRSPDPAAERALVRGRAALRESVEDPFSRLAALEELPLQIALPGGDCPVILNVLRTPVGPQADCEGRADDALAALRACALDRKDRDRVMAVLGQSWNPSDRARLTRLLVGPEDLDSSLPFGESVAKLLAQRD